SGAGRRDVPAMAVEEIKALEAVAGERDDVVADDGDQGRRPHRHRAREAEMGLRHADAGGRAGEGADPLAAAAPDPLPADRIGADEAVRPVLLGRADRNDDAFGALKIGLDLFPGLKMQLHRILIFRDYRLLRMP